MPYIIKKTATGRYKLYDDAGRYYGEHPTKARAQRQIKAVEASKRRRQK